MRKKGTVSILFWLHKSKGTATEAPLMCRITIWKQRYELSLNCKVPLKLWVTEVQRCKTTKDIGREINNLIDQTQAKINEAITRIRSDGSELSIEMLRGVLTNENNDYHSVLSLFDYHKVIEGNNIADSTMALYGVTRNHVAKFIRIKYRQTDVDIHKVKKDFAAEFFAYLQGWKRDSDEPVCHNNAAVKHLQRVSHVFTIAFENEWIDKNPLATFRTHTEAKSRDYLNEEEVKAIEQLNDMSAMERVVRDIFIFSVYTGIAYIDILHLETGNITLGLDGQRWIIFERRKTGNRCMIPILQPAEEIILRYHEAMTYVNKKRLLPVPTNQQCNRYLKSIAKKARIHKRVTFHVARHTFATTVTLLHDIPIETVSSMMGHANISTTQIYAKVVGQKIAQDTEALRALYQLKESTLKTAAK